MSLPIQLKTDEGLTITLKKGCITKEKVDVIVNSTTDSLSLDAGTLSSSILKAAGDQIQTECKQKCPNTITKGDVVETSGGSLSAKNIYHGSLSPWMSGAGEKDLLGFIRCFLDKADIDKKTSMSIPAITTGVLAFPHNVVAKVMHEEIVKFSRANPSTTLKDIRIVVFDDKTVQEFTAYFAGIPTQPQQPKPAATATETPLRSSPRPPSASLASRFLRSFFSPTASTGAHGDTTAADPPVTTPVSTAGAIASFNTGNNNITISVKKGAIEQQADDVIVNITTKDLRLNHGRITSAILKAGGQSIQQEADRKAPDGIEYAEVLETSPGKLKCKTVYHGALRQWSSGCGEQDLRGFISKVLQKACDDSHTSIAVPSIGTGIILGYPADKVAEFTLDEIKKFSDNSGSSSSVKTVNIVLFEKDRATIKAFQDRLKNTYKVDSQPTTDTRQVSTPEIPLPGNWTAMQDKELYKLVELVKSGEEYAKVSNRFTKYGGPSTIQKIERVQCPNMYQIYMVRKAQIEKSVTDKVKFRPERKLYHGTDSKGVDGINLFGFNRAYAGKNAKLLGYGTYFARKASYSASDTYSPADSDGLKRIYHCSVLTGEYTRGKSDLKVPPPKDTSNPYGEAYDTVADDLNNPSMFVVFFDNQAYPNYLITFK